MSENLASNTMDGIENAKQAFKNMLKDKNKWLMLYLILIIVFKATSQPTLYVYQTVSKKIKYKKKYAILSNIVFQI